MTEDIRATSCCWRPDRRKTNETKWLGGGPPFRDLADQPAQQS
jgi:hypothetical protein